MRPHALATMTLLALVAGCGIEDGTNLEPQPTDWDAGWAAVELYETAGPNGEWVAVSEAAIRAERNWIESPDGNGWDEVLWTDQPDGAREPYRPPVPGWVQDLRRENGGEWPQWFGPAERAFYRDDSEGVAAFGGGRCGDPEEPILFMEPPYSVAQISQAKRGAQRGSVSFVVGAGQETLTIVPPGSERNEARHRMNIHGTVTGFGPDRIIPGHGVVSPGCTPGFTKIVHGVIPADQIFTEVTLCVATSTYHHADNDYVLWYWDDETWTGKQCIDACPPDMMDADGNCVRRY